MQLENIKIEINDKYKKEFYTCFPQKKHDESKILFYTINDIVLMPNERKIISLELKISIDREYVLFISNNEKVAQLHGIFVLPQFINHNNNEFINITLWNSTSVKFHINKGDIISEAHLIYAPSMFELQKVKKV